MVVTVFPLTSDRLGVMLNIVYEASFAVLVAVTILSFILYVLKFIVKSLRLLRYPPQLHWLCVAMLVLSFIEYSLEYFLISYNSLEL